MRKPVLRILKVVVWLVVVAALAVYVRNAFFGFAGTDLLAAPAAAVFAALALLARPPYVVRPRSRKARRFRRMSAADLAKAWRIRRVFPWRLDKVTLRGKRFAIFRTLWLAGAIGVLAAAAALPFVRAKVAESLPKDLSVLLAYDPPVTTRVYSADHELICTFTDENRVRVPLEKIPTHVRQAFIAAEDKDFYGHHGIDPLAIVRAAIINYRNGATKQGASTLTQQVIKQVVLKNNERTYRRKLQEVVLAVEIEKRMTKDQILDVYLNHVFLGHGAYGVEAAAETYFGKSVGELTVAEAALIAGLPRAPSRYSPYNHFDRARARQAYVLGQMVDAGFITQAQADEARAQEIAMISREDPLNHTAAPYFCDHVRRELKRMFGNEAIFERGLIVQTSLDMKMQRAAESAVRNGLIDLERRIGWNGPEGKDAAYKGCDGPAEDVADGEIDVARLATVAGGYQVCVKGALFPVHPDDAARMNAWAAKTKGTLSPGDVMSVRIVSLPTVGAVVKQGKPPPTTRYAIAARRTGGPDHPEALQGALVAVDPKTGELKALVGGYDFVESQYDAATMAHRQPGSSIKPYVYLTALMRGMTVDEQVNDHPVCYPTASGTWCPQNYRGPNTVTQYYGNLPLRMALALSLNSVSVQLAAKVGIEDVIRTMRALGITSPLERVLPLAIGSASITPWEHVYAYAAIASGGHAMPKHPGATEAGIFLLKVTDDKGDVLLDTKLTSPEERPQAVPQADAYALEYLMRGVVEQGTGHRVLELQRPAAAKTGTTNDFRDTWFMGFTADLVAGVWVGRMTPQPIVKEATGASVALPIWLAFMKSGHPDVPAREFPVPDDVTLVRSPWGELMPLQRGRMPAKFMSGQPPTASFKDPSPF